MSEVEQEAQGPGRPSKYDPAFCETVERLGTEGASRAEIALELQISHQTLANWEAAHPEFLEATTRAREAAQGWWEKQGRKGIWSRDFNANAYRLQVMNRFPRDWRDRRAHEFSGPDGGPIRNDTLDVDPSDLTDEELERIAKGEPIAKVLADTRKAGAPT